MRVFSRSSLMSWGIATTVLAGDIPEFKYLPADMCIEVDVPQSIAVRESECPTFFLVNLTNGQILPMAFDGASTYETAEIINEGIRRRNRALIRAPQPR